MLIRLVLKGKRGNTLDIVLRFSTLMRVFDRSRKILRAPRGWKDFATRFKSFHKPEPKAHIYCSQPVCKLTDTSFFLLHSF